MPTLTSAWRVLCNQHTTHLELLVGLKPKNSVREVQRSTRVDGPWAGWLHVNLHKTKARFNSDGLQVVRCKHVGLNNLVIVVEESEVPMSVNARKRLALTGKFELKRLVIRHQCTLESDRPSSVWEPEELIPWATAMICCCPGTSLRTGLGCGLT